MKLIKSTVIFFALLLLVFSNILLIGINLYYSINPNTETIITENKIPYYYSEKSSMDLELEQINTTIKKSPKDISSLEISGWIPDWDIQGGYDSILKRPGVFDSISVFWLIPEEIGDGTIKVVLNESNPKILEYAKTSNTKIWGTIPLFKEDIINSILNSTQNTSRFISEIIKVANLYSYSGIDLDMESFYLADKLLFLDFLENLKAELSKTGKLLAVTVIPVWSDEIKYQWGVQTRKTLNYTKIGEIADEVRLMTYEYSGRNALKVGPIAPLEWMEKVLKFALYKGIPREKLILGIHNYSYDYSNRKIASEEEARNGIPAGDLEPAYAYFNGGLEKLLKNYEVEITFNEIWGEAIGQYTFEGAERILIFPTNRSAFLRKQLAADYGIKGVAYWRIGYEGEFEY